MFCLLKKLQLVIFTRFTKILLTGHVLAFVTSFILRSSPVLFCLVRRQLCFVIEGALRSAVRIACFIRTKSNEGYRIHPKVYKIKIKWVTYKALTRKIDISWSMHPKMVPRSCIKGCHSTKNQPIYSLLLKGLWISKSAKLFYALGDKVCWLKLLESGSLR